MLTTSIYYKNKIYMVCGRRRRQAHLQGSFNPVHRFWVSLYDTSVHPWTHVSVCTKVLLHLFYSSVPHTYCTCISSCFPRCNAHGCSCDLITSFHLICLDSFFGRAVLIVRLHTKCLALSTVTDCSGSAYGDSPLMRRPHGMMSTEQPHGAPKWAPAPRCHIKPWLVSYYDNALVGVSIPKELPQQQQHLLSQSQDSQFICHF